jgi:hypothetical protein
VRPLEASSRSQTVQFVNRVALEYQLFTTWTSIWHSNVGEGRVGHIMTTQCMAAWPDQYPG